MSALVVISFKDIAVNETVRENVEKRCVALGGEFPETDRYEVILAADGAGTTAHVHATGRGVDVASQGDSTELSLAADRAIDTVAKQLRKIHDKKIYARRREAQRSREKQRSDG